MKVSVAYYSDIGGRKENEDSVFMAENNGTLLAIVADGLGGYEFGKLASKMVTDTVSSELSNESVTEVKMTAAVEKANLKILQDQMHKGMKSTVITLWMDEARAVYSHVGDSRLYQFRGGEIVTWTNDHSLAYQDYENGSILFDEIRNNPDRNRLVRVLGSLKEVRIDTKTTSTQAGDAFLLCSDGFWETVNEEVMLGTLRDSVSVEDWLAKMKSEADNYESKNRDNHSAICIWI